MGPGVSTQTRESSWVERGERALKPLEERRQALDPECAINVGHGPRQRQAVLECVAGPRRRLGAVAEHPPTAIGRAPDVDCIKPQMRASSRDDTDQGSQEFRIAG